MIGLKTFVLGTFAKNLALIIKLWERLLFGRGAVFFIHGKGLYIYVCVCVGLLGVAARRAARDLFVLQGR